MKNRIEIMDDKVVIFIDSPKYGEHEVWIDKDDFELVSSFKGSWCLRRSRSDNLLYAQSQYKTIDGKWKSIVMHRLIMNPPKDLVVDHINHNGLDNRRENLRVITNAQNQQNKRGAYKSNKHKVRGVTFNERKNRYEAYVYSGGRKVFSRLFKTIDEAEKAVIEARLEIMEFATK